LVALLATVAGGTPATAETLRQAVDAAVSTNPVLASSHARQEALAETPEQARAAGRLTAAADGSAGHDISDYGTGGGATVSANLPIWTGGRVSSAVRAARSDVAAGEEGVRDIEAQLIATVVAVYSQLLYDQQAVDIATADNTLLDHQVAEARARLNLGQATRTDVAQLEAQRASGDATLANARAALATDQADYRAVVGHDAQALATPPDRLAALPGTIDQARSRALETNPVYQQHLRASDASDARIAVARANGAPSLSLGTSYGYGFNLTQPGGGGYVRAASAALVLHVPILTGGLVASQVRQASADHRADQYDADAAAREALRLAETAWIALGNAQAQVSANTDRVAAADLALKGVRAEYSFSLRTTLDILVADESLRAAQLALARSRSDALVAQADVLRATGRLTADSIAD
jgi:outer membrane protein